MQILWKRYGRTGKGVPEDGVEQIAEQISKAKLGRFFESAVHGTGELPLSRLLKEVGVDMLLRHAESMNDRGGKAAPTNARMAARRPDLGIRARAVGTDLKISHVLDDGSAQRAGLAAGDVIIAMNNLRVTGTNLEELLSHHELGDRMCMHVFRRDELMKFDIELSGPARDTCYLEVSPDKAYKKARRAWLGVI